MFDFGVLLVCVPNISSTHVNAGGEDLVKRLLTEYFASTVSTVLVELNLEDLWERRRWQFWWIWSFFIEYFGRRRWQFWVYRSPYLGEFVCVPTVTVLVDWSRIIGDFWTSTLAVLVDLSSSIDILNIDVSSFVERS
jgi:hypothetical protein